MVQTYEVVSCRPTVAFTSKVGSIAPVVALSRPRPACAVPLSQLNAPAT